MKSDRPKPIEPPRLRDSRLITLGIPILLMVGGVFLIATAVVWKWNIPFTLSVGSLTAITGACMLEIKPTDQSEQKDELSHTWLR